jgi:small subunit ribosomal protein S6e
MVDLRLVIGDPSAKKTYQKTLSSGEAMRLSGLKVGDILKGDSFELPGYEFEITGGSDKDGFPMRKGIPGVGKSRPLVSGGVGIKTSRDGERRKVTVHSENVDGTISQLNVKVLKAGAKPLSEVFVSAEKGKDEGSGSK